ncbi:MAG: TIGR01212 family radical SAM protein [Bacteroidales bacterium]|nr:TIGR01212 family radical SAM protein [Bacteroidales bacterium]
MGQYYTTYAEFLAKHFPWKMQKLSVDIGATCPNRDGRIGRGGCAYCTNASFVPAYCDPSDSVAEQLRKGKDFFGRKYSDMHYLAYFQAHTSTDQPVDQFLACVREAVAVDGVEGVVIGTRPDCMPQPLLEALAGLDTWVMIEYGAESANDATLARVNRCHTWADTVDAVQRTAALGIPVGLHLIAGLPGETLDDALTTVGLACQLPISVLKLHQLQILRGTPLALMESEPSPQEHGSRLETGSISQLSLDDYLRFCAQVTRIVPRTIAIDRWVSSAPSSLLISPRWSLKNYQFTHLLQSLLSTLAPGRPRQP